MKKFHLQAQVSVVELAEVTKAMRKAGLNLIKPPDVVRFCLQTVHSLLTAEKLTEDEALKFLQEAGYFSLKEIQQAQLVIGKAVAKQVAMGELEDLIKQVKKGPGISTEIKEMLAESMKGG